MDNSGLASLGNIFVDPKKTLRDIRPHTIWWLYPTIITLALTIAWYIWYFTSVDIGWLANQIVATMGDKYNSDQLDVIRQHLNRSYLLITSSVGAVVLTFVIYLLQALYFFLISKIGGYEEQSYGRWLNFTAWTMFPNVLAIVAMAIFYLFSNSQISPYAVDITSLNTLLFHLSLGKPLMSVAASIHLTAFWVLALMTVGFAQWTKKGLGKSAAIVLIPWISIYALWIIIKLA